MPKRKRDPEYLRRVRELPCCVCGTRTNVEAHHRTGAGLALKADDRDTMPLCTTHHRELHNLSGWFRAFDKRRLREWQSDHALITRVALRA